MSYQKKLFSTETKWEKIAGFSRAIRIGDQIFVAGRTATGADGIVGKSDQFLDNLSPYETVVRNKATQNQANAGAFYFHAYALYFFRIV